MILKSIKCLIVSERSYYDSNVNFSMCVKLNSNITSKDKNQRF